MYDFIYSKAKDLAVRNMAMVNGRIIYLWAMAYFNKSHEELGINKKNLISKKEIKKTEETKDEHKKENKKDD